MKNSITTLAGYITLGMIVSASAFAQDGKAIEMSAPEINTQQMSEVAPSVGAAATSAADSATAAATSAADSATAAATSAADSATAAATSAADSATDAAKAHTDAQINTMQNQAQDIEAQSIDLFTRLDADQDGIISKEEFSSVGSTQSFERIDMDTNGQISQVEIFQSMKVQQGS